jgi:hypothetical protein
VTTYLWIGYAKPDKAAESKTDKENKLDLSQPHNEILLTKNTTAMT